MLLTDMTHKHLPIYAITFVAAAVSIIYELLIAQTISLFLGNTVIWYSLIIGVYLGALGVGAILYDRFLKKRSAWISLLWVEIFLSIVGGVAVLTINAASVLFNYFTLEGPLWVGVVLFAASSLFVTTAVGFLSGFELPLLIRLGARESKHTKPTNKILASDYIGTLAGATLFPLLLLPHLSVITIGFLAALVNMAIVIGILIYLLREKKKIRARAILGFIIGALLLLVTGVLERQNVEQYFLQKQYYIAEISGDFRAVVAPMEAPHIERVGSLYQKIDIVKSIRKNFFNLLPKAFSTKYEEDPNYPDDITLFINGEAQFTSANEEVYHEYFAHVPIILNKKPPERVLVIGGGDGLLVRELLKHKEIEQIKLVDIDKKIIEIAQTHPELRAINKGSLSDPRVTIKIADGYSFVRNDKNKYDAIYVDLPAPSNYNISRLYSREFYYFLKKRLKADGYAVLDIPGIDASSITKSEGDQYVEYGPYAWRVYHDTIASAGFKTIIPFVSRLETDNKKAVDLLFNINLDEREKLKYSQKAIDVIDSLLVAEGEEKKQAVSTILNIYSSLLQDAFVMIKEKSDYISKEYTDPEVKLYILNEKRFNLAFLDSPESSKRIPEKKNINSIVKPGLPNLTSRFPNVLFGF